MKLHRVLLLLVSMLLIAGRPMAADKSDKGKYRLVNGKGYTVCEAFLKNLNAFPDNEPPMVCEQKIHPTHPEFSKPQWEEMDVQSNLNIVHAAEIQIKALYGRQEVEKPPFDKWLELFLSRIKSGEAKPRLMKATMALNVRGPETLIAYRPLDGECASNVASDKGLSGFGAGYFIFALRSEAGMMLEPVPADLLSRSILSYRGSPFFIRASSAKSESWGIRLYAVSSATPEQSRMNGYFLQQRCEFQVSKVTNR